MCSSFIIHNNKKQQDCRALCGGLGSSRASEGLHGQPRASTYCCEMIQEMPFRVSFPHVLMAGRPQQILHGGTLKYLFGYFKIRIFYCSNHTFSICGFLTEVLQIQTDTFSLSGFLIEALQMQMHFPHARFQLKLSKSKPIHVFVSRVLK